MGCGGQAPQAELVRYVALGGRLTLDRDRELPGRGAYLHWSKGCWEQALKRRSFHRALRCPVEIPPELGAPA